MWGSFFVALLGVLTWFFIRRARQRAALRRKLLAQPGTKAEDAAAAEAELSASPLTEGDSPPTASPADQDASSANALNDSLQQILPSLEEQRRLEEEHSRVSLFDTYWGMRWVRRSVLLLRLVYILADVALDIAIAVWLFMDGNNHTAAVVCTVFVLLAQVGGGGTSLGEGEGGCREGT